MIGLSVAIGRFVEALIWGMLRVGGVVAAAVLGGVAMLVVAALALRRILRR